MSFSSSYIRKIFDFEKKTDFAFHDAFKYRYLKTILMKVCKKSLSTIVISERVAPKDQFDVDGALKFESIHHDGLHSDKYRLS